jgi:hypothetical protein
MIIVLPILIALVMNQIMDIIILLEMAINIILDVLMAEINVKITIVAYNVFLSFIYLMIIKNVLKEFLIAKHMIKVQYLYLQIQKITMLMVINIA